MTPDLLSSGWGDLRAVVQRLRGGCQNCCPEFEGMTSEI